MTMGILREK